MTCLVIIQTVDCEDPFDPEYSNGVFYLGGQSSRNDRSSHLPVPEHKKQAFGGVPRDWVIAALRPAATPCWPGYLPLHCNEAAQKATADIMELIGRAATERWCSPECPVQTALPLASLYAVDDEADVVTVVIARGKVKGGLR